MEISWLQLKRSLFKDDMILNTEDPNQRTPRTNKQIQQSRIQNKHTKINSVLVYQNEVTETEIRKTIPFIKQIPTDHDISRKTIISIKKFPHSK